MTDIPRDEHLESSLALLGEGYPFIRDRCQRLHSNLFQTRLLMQNTICLSGQEAARLFYDERYLQRDKAMPRMLKKTLIGEGGVQGLDGEAHRQRKRMFMQLLDSAAVDEVVRLTEQGWCRAIDEWQARSDIELMSEVQSIFTDSVCRWAGVPLPSAELPERRDQLVAMIDGAGGIGARHWAARKARREAEIWLQQLIKQARSGELQAAPTTALMVVAHHRNLDGSRLDSRVAAVELLNLLRPTVAVSYFIIYGALELLAHPQWRERLRSDDAMLEPFAQEVRRLHAFFPFTAARVREGFEWQGYHFPAGTRVMLDLWGTNREASRWSEPDAFQPERFVDWQDNAFSFVTQGGGDPAEGHRCPGERLAIELLKVALRTLTREMEYAVPAQDLRIDLTRMPAKPQSGLLISDVKRLAG
ncbi:cytochrome P450 [Stutzerimonas decontaminans]|uniref:Cytochrome P450 n=2 Tax=Stutzerimonas TaxID=2901164 RepID=A0ABX4VWA3_9GAMM|nr:cytochrome P450 [Stutzerimonas decontaminans]AHY44065.1 cytochrome P450 [Stutzerimonas decontaminans]MCQ4243836.1 cytochrome P450 [Stutzerimonas decontaminans]PNF83332.1 cytochrome P450 [Stutzerimonas decontaminans]